jgi:hypothetical protein
MKKSVNVVLNSKNAIAGSLPNNASYYVNFRNLLKPNQSYKMHFTYIGGANLFKGYGASNYVASVYADFNTNSVTNNATAGSTTTQLIGFLKPVVLVGANSSVYLQAEDGTNLPLYLENGPNNSILNIRVLDQAGNPWLDDNPTAVSATGSTASGVLTITAVSAGIISVGSTLTLSATTFTVLNILTLTTAAGVGTYSITHTGSLGAGAVTSVVTNGISANTNAPYQLALRFTEVEVDQE